MTAGNSSQMSDGAAAAIVTSKSKASERGWKVLGRFVAYATAGVKPEEMGIGPAMAIPKALKLAGLKLEDIGLIELNEAFAAQALAVIREADSGSAQGERERWRDRPRTSARLHRREAHGSLVERNEAPPSSVWHGDDVRRRRHGSGRDF